MSDETETSNLPAQTAEAFASVLKALVPGILKALDRLVSAGFDIPTARLEQKKAKINAQTESYKLVEAAIAQQVAARAGADAETVQRAMGVLVRKEYRKQTNREAVATEMLKDMHKYASNPDAVNVEAPSTDLDEDWLNVFERYAEDASSERLQGLWGRVLAGEIRKPGRFSTRTLRFLSEFSQADALNFEIFSKSAFGHIAPRKLVIKSDEHDITPLIYMESNGLIQGVTTTGLMKSFPFNELGFIILAEGNLRIVFKGNPGERVIWNVLILTVLGQELLSLVSSRDPSEAARVVANSVRSPELYEAYIGVGSDSSTEFRRTEVLWLKDKPAASIVEGSAG